MSRSHPVDQPERRFFVYPLVIYVQFVSILFLTGSVPMKGDFWFWLLSIALEWVSQQSCSLPS